MDITAAHNSQSTEYRRPFGAVPCGRRVTLRIAVDGDADGVSLRLWYDNSERVFPMKKRGGSYSAEAVMPDTPGLVWYFFIITKNGERLYYGKDGALNAVGKLYGYQPDSFQITVYDKAFHTPRWFADAVMYQIFVDRFYNGNDDYHIFKKRGDYEILHDWNSPIPYDKARSESERAKNYFYGGNLKGIIKKLDYLSDLGISALYLNPIFDAYSNHKYDTGDYMKIDQMFGDEEIFRDLCEKAEERGIAVILDGVFSHTGIDSKYFNKWGNYDSVGAYQSKESPYFDWYNFERYPEVYACWWGVTTLPNVNEMTNSYREFIINGEDSVVKHWLRCGAKGWRLDVADELPDKFIKELRDAAKSTDGQSVIIGEVWEDASNKVSYGVQREYLLGGELDSVMNYPFRDGVTGYIMGWHGAEHFEKIVMSVYENYPLPCFYSLMNLIGGHDVTRAKTLFGNAPDLPPEERAAYRHDYDADLLAGKRMRLASLWQLTFPGVPCIYYGDEIGMEGYSDPFNRAPFRWDDMDAGLLEWYQKLIKIRNGFAPLRTGGYETIFAEGDIFCYKREIRRGRDALGSKRESGTAYIALNRSEYSARRVSIGTGAYRALYDPVRNETIPTDGGKVELTLPPVSGVLYIGKNLVD